MKKLLLNLLIALVLTSSLSSCATIFGGKVTQAQRTRPLAGEPSRALRPVPLIFDIVLFWPGLVVDFLTGAIYRPEGNGMPPKVIEKKADSANTGGGNTL
ncbi:hypothetical protein ACSBL2_12485 [Pedobacter sp. AW31-3R]|uniref:hypothetical protein n=1 Tax=Pedobacter sp. AW31-3R TaxID=3445781 RepID=UPI003F9F1CBF